MKKETRRIFELTELEFFTKTAQQINAVLVSSGIIDKLEPIRADQLVTRRQVAKEYGVSLVTLDKWAKYGQIPKPTKKGGRVYYSRKELNAFNLKTKKR